MKKPMSRTMVKRTVEIIIAAFLYSAALSGTLQTMAAVSGNGSAADPVTGIAEPGDEIPADVYVINLTETDGTKIYMNGRYEPKEYAVIFDAAGGSFPDGTKTQEIRETYDDQVRLPGEPLRPGCVFTAWYLKGNRKPAEPAEADGTLLSEDTRFMLAADDAEDMAKAEADAAGRPVAKALWRKNTLPADGENAADEPAPSPAENLWDPAHTNNHVIEWIPELPGKADYRKKHGVLHYQYGSILLTAETEGAAAYHWYVKKAAENSFTAITETGPELLLEGLTREDDGAFYKCEVSVGEEDARLSYETQITVYRLPEPEGIRVSIDGGKTHEYG